MPVYQYEGKHYDLPEGLSNEQAISKIEAYLGKPKEQETQSATEEGGIMGYLRSLTEKAMTPQYTGGVASGISKGLTDPITGTAQLGLKVAEAMGSQEAAKQAELLRQREKQYEETVAGQGIDVSRIAGNIMSPLSYVTGPGSNFITKAATTGAIQGAMQPVSNEDFWGSKAIQTSVGAGAGAALSGGAYALNKVASIVKSLTPSGRQEALRQHLSTLAGEDQQAVIKALQDAKELVTGSRPTAAEALADVPSAVELLNAQKKLSETAGLKGKFAVRAADQQAARVRALQGIAGSEADRAALITARDASTGQTRELALNQADIVKEAYEGIEKTVLNEARKNLKASQELTPFRGTPSDWFPAAAEQKATNLKMQQLADLEANGIFALETRDVVSNLNKAIKGATSDTSKAVLSELRNKILSKTDADGLISSRDLYENVRKTSNQDIAKLLGLGDQFASGGIPEQAAKALGNAKKFIDAALDKSTNGTWSKYLNDYTNYSKKLNRMEIGDYLVKRLQTPLDKERAGVFATAVENAAGTIKRSTGIPRYDKLEQVLTADEVKTVNNVLADLTRKTKAEQLARTGGRIEGGLPDVAGNIPSLLSRTVAIAREGIQWLQRGNQQKFNEKMAELMLDPKGLALFMTEGVPKGQVNNLTSAIMKYSSPEVQNALTSAFTVQPLSRAIGE